ncbi:MAG: acyltransferase domain-containing protein [Duodenibacillus sp.]|nr:acyltransferase domain-containing protein [Duodenibacillus sp.]
METALGGKAAFVYSGNGSQWVGMGRGLLEGSAAFAGAVDEVDRAFGPLAGWSLAERMRAPDEAWDIGPTEVAQPMVFACQVGMTAMMREAGLGACAYVGHSLGEIAAAWAAGALGLADAARVIYERSSRQGTTRGAGTMAAVRASDEALARMLEAAPGVSVAGLNAPANWTVTGPADAVAALVKAARAQGGKAVKLDLDYAFHGPAMEPIKEGLVASLASLAPRPAPAFYSSVTGAASRGMLLDAGYWWRNVRQPVRFGDAVAAMLADGVRHVVEIGPHAVLLSYVKVQAQACGVEIQADWMSRRGEGAAEVAAAMERIRAGGWPAP